MRRTYLGVFLAGVLVAACEEGPDQIYKPNPADTDFSRFNGWRPVGFVNEGKQPFTAVSSGQKSGTVKICEADELATRWGKMVKEPIVPAKGAGGLDLQGTNWAGLTVDQAQQQLCQAYVYSDGMVYWGDNAELIGFYDSTTRLIDRLVTLTGYEGTITAGAFEIANNKAIMKDGKALANPGSPENLRAMNTELLKKFRPEVTSPESRDCVALSTCYVMDWYTLKRYVFNDLMLDFATEPGGKIDHIGINLKRSFEFGKADVKFEMTPAPTAGLAPVPRIDSSATCHPTLGDTWGHIKQNCLGIDPEAKALIQPAWNNEAMAADMGGLAVYLTRTLAADQIIPDDAKPTPTDIIVGVGFNSTYDGKLVLNRADLYNAFFAAVASAAEALVPTIEVLPKLTVLKPKGDADKLTMGTQKVEDCSVSPCQEHTLTIRTREIVEAEIKAAGGTVPLQMKQPNFYTELFLRELLRIFNEEKVLTPTDVYFFPADDTADILYARMNRSIGSIRHGMTAVYHNKSDQLISLFFKQGVLRTESVLLQDAELKQGDGSMGDGIFRLWNLATSPRLGLAKELFPKSVNLAKQRAVVSVDLGAPTDVLVTYNPEDSLSGFSIPVKGQRDLFVPTAYYGFSGSNIGASIYAGGKDGIIKAVSSGAFYDQLDFCGVKVSLYDPVDALLKKLPQSCEKLLSWSENGKILYSLSTYVQTAPYKIGLRISTTAGRIDHAYYWAEE